MNYPRIWTLLPLLGFSDNGIPWAGGLFLGLFVIAVLRSLPVGLTHAQAIYAMVFLASPSVLLCVERGNTDLLMFALVAFALFLLSKNRVSGFVAVSFVAFLLKLYPVLGLAALLHKPTKKSFLGILISIGLALAYVFMTWGDLLLIRRGTMVAHFRSYGVLTWCPIVQRYSSCSIELLQWISYGGVALISIVVLSLGLMQRARCDDRNAPAVMSSPDLENTAISGYQKRTSFFAGAAIYCGTFLLGGNFDYRHIFLFFVIWQLGEWSRCALKWIKYASRCALTCVAIVTWYAMIPVLFSWSSKSVAFAAAIDLLASWTLYGVLLFLVAAHICMPKCADASIKKISIS